MNLNDQKIDGVLRAINVSSDLDHLDLYEVAIVPDGPPDAADVNCRVPRDEALALVPLLGKKVRVTLTPKIEAR